MFFISCSNIKSSESSIDKFEKIIGKKESEYLNLLNKDLTDFLNQYFPNENHKFKTYLWIIQHEDNVFIWQPKTEQIDSIFNEKLVGKFKTTHPVSVWINDNVLEIHYPNGNSIGHFLNSNKKPNTDSLIEHGKKEVLLELVQNGCFYIALDSLKEREAIIEGYIYAKESFNYLPISTLAGGLFNNLTNENEYFARRIFIIESITPY